MDPKCFIPCSETKIFCLTQSFLSVGKTRCSTLVKGLCPRDTNLNKLFHSTLLGPVRLLQAGKVPPSPKAIRWPAQSLSLNGFALDLALTWHSQTLVYNLTVWLEVSLLFTQGIVTEAFLHCACLACFLSFSIANNCCLARLTTPHSHNTFSIVWNIACLASSDAEWLLAI